MAKPFSDDVVAKAEKIFADAGLKRSGKTIATSATSDVSRGISTLARSRRSLKLVDDTWKQTAGQLALLRRQYETLNAQNIDLNLQLARGGGTVSAHNQMVAMNNANVAAMRQLTLNEERIKEKLAIDRKALNDAEAAYAEAVLALRRDLNSIKIKLDEDLKNDQIAIALKVSSTNFGTPTSIDTNSLVAGVEKRLVQVEQEVFNETITLDVVNGSLYVNVSVGDVTTRMVVDSGASLICLPASTAAELGITVPSDAKAIRLVLADGREIPGRAVKLAKVRVGQFEAEDVDAAVLDAVATSAEPLLGMSFLGNFKFEIDTADKSLKLLRVKAD